MFEPYLFEQRQGYARGMLGRGMLTRRVFIYATALLIGVVSSCHASPSGVAVPALDSVTSIDSPFCAFAGERFHGVPGLKAVESGGDSEAAKLHSRPLRATPHWRSLAFANPAHEASFVDASATVPARSLMTMAEEVFDRVSVAGGVLVMGLSMVLP